MKNKSETARGQAPCGVCGGENCRVRDGATYCRSKERAGALEVRRGGWYRHEIGTDPPCGCGHGPHALPEAVAAEPADSNGKGVRVTAFDRIAAVPVRWLWPGRIPRSALTIIDGDAGTGKTALVLDLIARVTAGLPLPGESVSPGPAGAVVVSFEDDVASTLRPRLEAAGADLGRVVAVEVGSDADGWAEPTITPEGLAAVEQAVREVGAAVVLFDPLVAALAPETNSHRDQDVRRALAMLRRLAEATTAAVVAIRHLNKREGGPAIHRGGGSVAFGAAARAVHLVARDPDSPESTGRILAPVKMNLAAEPPALRFRLEPHAETVRIGWQGACAHTAASLLAIPEGFEQRSALAEAEDLLRERLADGPAPSRDIEAEARNVGSGVSRRTLMRARARLGVRALKRDDGWYLELPGKGATHETETLSPATGTLGILEATACRKPLCESVEGQPCQECQAQETGSNNAKSANDADEVQAVAERHGWEVA